MRRLLIAAAAVVVLGLAAFWLVTTPEKISASALPARPPDLANGKVMFYAGGCASCHASDPNDPTRLGGGPPLKSVFGTFHPPNISPDPEDGIGRWGEADFVNALLRGTSPDGQHYYPAFPYPSYQHMRLDDARDLFAYLKSLPPVKGRTPDQELAFPLGWRRLVGGWNLLFLDGQPFRPDPSQSAQWNRGAYLVNGPAHCAECHSPRNALGGIEVGKRFAGGPELDGQGWVPNITQKGLGDYSVEDIADLLETGRLPNGDSVGGSMRAVIRNTSQLPAADREAMAVYLKSLAPVEGPSRSRPKS